VTSASDATAKPAPKSARHAHNAGITAAPPKAAPTKTAPTKAAASS